MRQTRTSKQTSGERIVKHIKRKTRKQYSAQAIFYRGEDPHCAGWSAW